MRLYIRGGTRLACQEGSKLDIKGEVFQTERLGTASKVNSAEKPGPFRDHQRTTGAGVSNKRRTRIVEMLLGFHKRIEQRDEASSKF